MIFLMYGPSTDGLSPFGSLALPCSVPNIFPSGSEIKANHVEREERVSFLPWGVGNRLGFYTMVLEPCVLLLTY
jgi:hypothetical protein